jgi:hypothetical protein
MSQEHMNDSVEMGDTDAAMSALGDTDALMSELRDADAGNAEIAPEMRTRIWNKVAAHPDVSSMLSGLNSEVSRNPQSLSVKVRTASPLHRSIFGLAACALLVTVGVSVMHNKSGSTPSLATIGAQIETQLKAAPPGKADDAATQQMKMSADTVGASEVLDEAPDSPTDKRVASDVCRNAFPEGTFCGGAQFAYDDVVLTDDVTVAEDKAAWQGHTNLVVSTPVTIVDSAHAGRVHWSTTVTLTNNSDATASFGNSLTIAQDNGDAREDSGWQACSRVSKDGEPLWFIDGVAAGDELDLQPGDTAIANFVADCGSAAGSSSAPKTYVYWQDSITFEFTK